MIIEPKLSINTKQITACVIGTIFEWYDIALFGALTPYLSRVFFPNQNSALSLLFTLLIFTSGFMIRPIGAIIFGHLGDRYGRRSTLVFTFITMSLSTVSIGCLPSYDSIGYISSLILLLIRLLQGLAVSGEHSGTITYLYEIDKSNKQGFLTSLSYSGVMIGTLFATLTNFLLNCLFSYNEILNWAWRIPFIFSIVLCLVGIYFRKISSESLTFESLLINRLILRYPLKKTIENYKYPLLSSILILAISYVIFYTIIIFIPIYLVQINKISELSSSLITSIDLIIMASITPVVGYLSDKIGHTALMKISVIGFLIFSYPLFALIHGGNIKYTFGILITFSILNSLYLGPSGKLLIDAFEPNVRYTAVSIVFNITAAIFGGTAPLFLHLIERSNLNVDLPLMYTSVLALISYFIIYNKTSD